MEKEGEREKAPVSIKDLPKDLVSLVLDLVGKDSVCWATKVETFEDIEENVGEDVGDEVEANVTLVQYYTTERAAMVDAMDFNALEIQVMVNLNIYYSEEERSEWQRCLDDIRELVADGKQMNDLPLEAIRNLFTKSRDLVLVGRDRDKALEMRVMTVEEVHIASKSFAERRLIKQEQRLSTKQAFHGI